VLVFVAVTIFNIVVELEFGGVLGYVKLRFGSMSAIAGAGFCWVLGYVRIRFGSMSAIAGVALVQVWRQCQRLMGLVSALVFVGVTVFNTVVESEFGGVRGYGRPRLGSILGVLGLVSRQFTRYIVSNCGFRLVFSLQSLSINRKKFLLQAILLNVLKKKPPMKNGLAEWR